MKLFLLVCLLSLYFLGTINAAAVDTVVEKETDIIEVDVNKASLDNVDENCHQPREMGRCFALFYRYAFNAENLKCEQFIYGGCGGNNNNFQTLEECEKKCLKKEAENTKDSKAEHESDKESENVTEIKTL